MSLVRSVYFASLCLVLGSTEHLCAEELCASMVADGGSAVGVCGEAPFHSTNSEVIDLHLVQMTGMPLRVALWKEWSPGESLTPFYAVSRNGISFSEVRATSYLLRLKFAEFDPSEVSINMDLDLFAESNGRTYIVQFVSHLLPEYRAMIGSLGGEVRGFLPNHGMVVEIDAASVQEVEAIPFVRTVIPYHPGFKLESWLRDNLESSAQLFPLERYSVKLFAPGGVRGPVALEGTADLKHQ